METYWINENETYKSSSNSEIKHRVSEVATAAELLNDMTMADGYADDHYCHQLDNLGFGPFDEYFFANSEKIQGQEESGQTMNKIFVKKEPGSKFSASGNEALPVVPNLNLKMQQSSHGQYRYSCNLRPNELRLETAFSPTSDLGSSCSASPAVDLDSPDSSSMGVGGETGFEVYHDLIMRHLIQDIQGTCARLNIPRDPKTWTAGDSNAWLMDMSAQYHLSQVPYDKLSIDGSTLCSMSLGEFVQCFPNGGETVHAQLQIWNSANEYCSNQHSLNSNPVMISVNSEEPMMALNEEHQHQQFVQLNPNGVIQRLRSVVDDGPSSGFNYPVPFLLQHQEPFGNVGGQLNAAPYGLGSLLPSPGSCSDSGLSIEGDYATLNVGGALIADTPTRTSSSGNGSNIHLWQFLRELLEQPDRYAQCVRWIDHGVGIFKIEDSHNLARLWGKRKNRPAMNYDKLSRSLRQYYKKNILKKTTRSQRLVYQFLHPYHVC